MIVRATIVLMMIWWWLPTRLSKCQSMSPQTVLLRTTLTRLMIWLGFKPFTMRHYLSYRVSRKVVPFLYYRKPREDETLMLSEPEDKKKFFDLRKQTTKLSFCRGLHARPLCQWHFSGGRGGRSHLLRWEDTILYLMWKRLDTIQWWCIFLWKGYNDRHDSVVYV